MVGSRAWRRHVARSLDLGDARSAGTSRLRSSARTPNPRDAGGRSRGAQCPGEHRPEDRALARDAVWLADRDPSRVVELRERTLEESKALKWACWPPKPASPDCPRRGAANDHGDVVGSAPSGSGEPSSRPVESTSPSGELWASGRRGGETDRETLGHGRADGRSSANPPGRKGPRERVRLLEKGKL